MVNNDFTLIYKDGSKKLFCTGSLIYISKTDTKKSIPDLKILLCFQPNYIDFYQPNDGYLPIDIPKF